MELVKWDKMKQAITECHKIDEIKLIRDKAEAYRYALILAKESPEYIRKAEEIKLRAERRAGEILKEIPLTQGARGIGKKVEYKASIPLLQDFNITTNQSSNWQHIANIPEKEFETYIAVSKELATSGAVKLSKSINIQEKKFKNMELPEGTYQVILADPPWKYNNTGFEMSAENKYPTMSVDDILAKIKFKTTENAILFMWVTNPMLEEGLKLINGWGFQYKTNFVWIKKNHTAGFYVLGQHELLLIAVKGNKMLPTGEKFKSIITGDNNKHSKKPESVYEIIEKMYPNYKYLELFARNTREGWESFGNEL